MDPLMAQPPSSPGADSASSSPTSLEIVRNPSASTDTRDPAAPQIPDHTLIAWIGGGSYGEVWLARTALGTPRAVKVVRRGRFDNVRPYEREFAGIKKFEPVSRLHEGLVDILHVGRNDEAGFFYYVMELADAAHAAPASPARSLAYSPRTLASEIAARGRLPMAECLPAFLTLTSGMAFLHRQGLLHRDIKPSNIIFVGGVAKLADIGLVTEAAEARTFVGTEGFIPPEGPGTRQADLYSLAKTFYEAATGMDRLEFPSLPLVRGQPEENRALVELHAVLAKACARDPAERYRSADEMQGELALLQSGKSVKRLRAVEQRLRRAGRLGLATFLIAVLALGTVVFTHHRAREAAQREHQEHQANERLRAALYDAHLAHARAAQGSVLAGARAATLGGLTNAVALRGPSAELRSEAITALARLDVVVERQWPSHYLPDGYHARQCFDSDLRWRAVGQPDGSIRLLNADDDSEGAVLPSPGVPLVQVGPFSPDGTKLMAISRFLPTNQVYCWDIAARQVLWSHVGEPTLRADSLHFAGDRMSLSALDNETTFLIWNLTTGAERRFSLPYRPTTFSVTPDLHWLAVANSDLQGAGRTHVSLLDLTTGLWRTLDVGVKAFHVAWHPDARRLMVALTDFRLGIWDLSRPALPPAMLMGHGGNVEHSAFSLGGDWLLTSGFDNSMRLWGVDRSRPLAVWTGQVHTAQFSPDHRHLGYSTLAADELVRLRVERSAVCKTLAENDPHPSQGPFQAHFLAGGRLLACAARDGGRIFDTVTGRQLAHLPGGPSYGGGVDPNEDALWLMNGGEGSLTRWPIERVSALEWRFGPRATVPPPAGGFNLVSPAAGILTVHPAQGILLRPDKPEPLDDSIGCRPLALSTDQRWLAGATVNEIKLWDASSNVVVHQWALSNVLSGAFSANGAWLATVQSERLVVLEVGSGAKRWEAPGAFSSNLTQAPLAPPVFSPDGRLLAVVDSASRVALHDAATGELLAFIAHPEFEPLASVAFSADSGQLAVVCYTHLVQLWDLRRLRSELAALGLDWTHPPLPSAPEQRGEARVSVED